MLVAIFLMVTVGYTEVAGLENDVVLKTMSVNYGRQLYPCLRELDLGQDVLTDFLYFWKTDYEFTNEDVGCAVICVNKKLNLLDKTGRLSQPHAEAWIKAAGGDENMAQYLIYLYQSCQTVAIASKPCRKALEETNCFRKAIQRAQWSPKVPVVVQKSSDG